MVLFADDIGYTDLGCFGSEIRTPNLDRLAADGRRFTQMYNNPRCCPSRASLLTGLYPTQAGVGYMTRDQGTPQYQGYLNDSCVTLAEALGRVGYQTAISGKWHVAPPKQLQAWPYRRGFQRSFCTAIGGCGYYTPRLYLNGTMIGRPTDSNFFLTDAVTEYAVESIRDFTAQPDHAPFFLYAAYHAPHYPLHARPEDIKPYHNRYRDGWAVLRHQRYEAARKAGVIDARWRLSPADPGMVPHQTRRLRKWEAERMAVYAAMITTMDRGIGRIIDTLHERGVAEDTLVLFLGDNGASAEIIRPGSQQKVPTANGRPMRSGNIPGLMPGPSNTFQSYGQAWANASNTPFRMFKRWTDEGGISTPCVASWPGTLADVGGIDHRVLHITDLMPTFLELAEASYPTNYRGHPIIPMEGESFAKALTQKPGSTVWDRRKPLFWEHRGNRAVRDGRWKLVSSFPGEWELYDMLTDRTETRDLAALQPVRVTEMAAAYGMWKARVGVRNWHPGRQYRP